MKLSKLWKIHQEKIKGLHFKASGHRILFLIKYVPWRYFLECSLFFFLTSRRLTPQTYRGYKLPRQYGGISPQSGLPVASRIISVKCYLRTISSQINVSFKISKVLNNLHNSCMPHATLWDGYGVSSGNASKPQPSSRGSSYKKQRGMPRYRVPT